MDTNINKRKAADEKRIGSQDTAHTENIGKTIYFVSYRHSSNHGYDHTDNRSALNQTDRQTDIVAATHKIPSDTSVPQSETNTDETGCDFVKQCIYVMFGIAM